MPVLGQNASEVNLNSTSPAIPAGKVPVTFQAGPAYPDPNNPTLAIRDVSGYVNVTGSVSIQTASGLGCILDCNLLTGAKIGGGTPTDNTALINAFLATATATAPVKLIMDGPSACTGIKIPAGGHVTIEGIGNDSGFWILSGSNNDVIGNAPGSGASLPYNNDQGAAPAQGSNVVLRDFYIGGNIAGNSTSGSFWGLTSAGRQIMFMGIRLQNLTDILIENVTVYNCSALCVALNNVSRVNVRGCTFEEATPQNGNSAINVAGPASFINIADCKCINFGDDNIALFPAGGSGGPITDVAISGCLFQNAYTAVRVSGLNPYWSPGATQYPASGVVVANCAGSIAGCGGGIGSVFCLGNCTSGLLDLIENFKASNCTFTLDANSVFLKIEDNCGDIELSHCAWDSPVAANAFVYFDHEYTGYTFTISNLTLSRCTIYRSMRGSAAAYGMECPSGSTAVFGRLSLDFAVVNEAGETYAAITDLFNMANISIGELYVESLDTTLILALAASLSAITEVSGPGVLGAGFGIPDAQMANNCLYVSATAPHAGYVCVKIGSVVYVVSPAAALANFTGDSGSGGTAGLVPAPSAGSGAAGKFLAATGAWALPASSLVYGQPLTDGNSNFIFADGDAIEVQGAYLP